MPIILESILDKISRDYNIGSRNEAVKGQGCQMVCFQTQNPILGKIWRALEKNMRIYFMVIWNILRSFDIFYGHLVMLW
jgi:hypothetical protein